MTKQQIDEAKEHRKQLQAILNSGLVADTSARAGLRMEINRLTRALDEKENGRRAGRPSGLRERLKYLVAHIVPQLGATVKEEKAWQ